MKPRVYVETSVVSYLAARASRDLIVAARQQLTHEWWDDQRPEFDLFISQAVLQEAAAGDPDVAQRRLLFLEDIPSLVMSDAALELSLAMLSDGAVPAAASEDALHIAVAAVNGMDFLLTWNCRHIANAMMRARIGSVCEGLGYLPPILCTPEELTKP